MIKKIQNDAGVRIQFKAGLFALVQFKRVPIQIFKLRLGRRLCGPCSPTGSSSATAGTARFFDLLTLVLAYRRRHQS